MRSAFSSAADGGTAAAVSVELDADGAVKRSSFAPAQHMVREENP
jgi:hypothetical protein